MSLDPARRAGLERSRAVAIARDHFDVDPTTASVDAAPFGVVVRAGERAVIVSASDDPAVLGGVLVWLSRNETVDAVLVVEHHAGVHARRAAVLAPQLVVHALSGGAVAPAPAEPIAPPYPTPEDIAPFVAMIERSGADAVIEDGIVRAEVAGLEVGRVVTGPAGSSFEVGVGRFDREAGALLHADRPVEPTLVDTIERIRRHRRPGAPSDAVNRIGRERWIRTLVQRDARAFGFDAVTPVEPVPPRTSLLETRPAALVATADDTTMLALCTVGVDLGVVPEAADLLAVTGATHVRVIAPARDHLPYLRTLLDRLPCPADLHDVAAPWLD